jgi:hypothetical protein
LCGSPLPACKTWINRSYKTIYMSWIKKMVVFISISTIMHIRIYVLEKMRLYNFDTL